MEVDDAEDPLGCGQRLLNRVVRTGEPADRRIGHEHSRQKREERPRRHVSADDEIAAVPDDGRNSDHPDHFHVRRPQRRNLNRLHRRVQKRAVTPVKPFGLRLFTPVGLYHANA